MEKKIKIEKEVKKEGSSNLDSYNKQFKAILGIMVVLIAIALLSYWIIQANKNFEYNGLKFYKEKEGTNLFYKSLLGFVTAWGEEVPFILRLKNDPRELAKIPIDGDIRLNKEAIISLSPEIADCPHMYSTLVDFGIILKAFGVTASGATTDADYARENNATLADCRSSLNKTVIVMQEGNKTQISQEKIIFKNCYVIEIANCEVREGFERFILNFIENSMASYDGK